MTDKPWIVLSGSQYYPTGLGDYVGMVAEKDQAWELVREKFPFPNESLFSQWIHVRHVGEPTGLYCLSELDDDTGDWSEWEEQR